FYSKEVFAFLQDEGIPHIMPVKKYGAEMNVLLIGNCARNVTYTMKGKGKPLDLNIARDVQYLQGKNGKYGNINLGYVAHGLDWKPRKIYNTYKTRFAIEASYRIRNSVKCKTSSKNVTNRYLYAVIALLLKNIWVALQNNYFSPKKKGPRTIDEDWFRFDLFRMLVWEGIRKVLRPIMEIPVLRSSV
ncbi:MAG: ISH3 family transposase, partial [Massilibacteroides sp.]|nr:ISH3 family transposase [Massilibacteroides sp.]